MAPSSWHPLLVWRCGVATGSSGGADATPHIRAKAVPLAVAPTVGLRGMGFRLRMPPARSWPDRFSPHSELRPTWFTRRKAAAACPSARPRILDPDNPLSQTGE